VRDALAGAGFPARMAQVGIAFENLVIHGRPRRAAAPFVVGRVAVRSPPFPGIPYGVQSERN